MKPTKVFVSYDAADHVLAEEVLRTLRSIPVEVWSADQLGTGESWSDEHRSRLRESDHFVLLLTPNTHGSWWVSQELGAVEAPFCITSRGCCPRQFRQAHAMPSRRTGSETRSTPPVAPCAATSVGLSALAVAGPVREQPRPSHPTAQSPRGGDPGGARRKALVTADASAPGGAGPPTRQPRWGAEAPRSRSPARG